MQMHVDKWLLSAAWYCQNTFLILLLLSSNCKKCYLVSYKGLLHCCVSSFCLCSALLTTGPCTRSVYVTRPSWVWQMEHSHNPAPCCFSKQEKHTGSETTWVDFKEKHLTQKKPQKPWILSKLPLLYWKILEQNYAASSIPLHCS